MRKFAPHCCCWASSPRAPPLPVRHHPPPQPRQDYPVFYDSPASKGDEPLWPTPVCSARPPTQSPSPCCCCMDTPPNIAAAVAASRRVGGIRSSGITKLHLDLLTQPPRPHQRRRWRGRYTSTTELIHIRLSVIRLLRLSLVLLFYRRASGPPAPPSASSLASCYCFIESAINTRSYNTSTTKLAWCLCILAPLLLLPSRPV